MLSAHHRGVLVDVWVVPGSSRDSVGGVHGGRVRVRTTAAPADGAANRAVARLLAEALGARHAAVVSGGGSRRKRVLVEGIEVDAARRRLVG